MKHSNVHNPGTNCIYPGEFIPAPHTLKEFLTELEKPLEGQTTPLINVAEMLDSYSIEIAAPGLNREDFMVSIEKNVLKIAVLHKDTEESKKLYYQHEFNYNCFQKDFLLPENIDTAFISAMYKDGILFIRLPKSDEQILNDVERIIIY